MSELTKDKELIPGFEVSEMEFSEYEFDNVGDGYQVRIAGSDILRPVFPERRMCSGDYVFAADQTGGFQGVLLGLAYVEKDNSVSLLFGTGQVTDIRIANSKQLTALHASYVDWQLEEEHHETLSTYLGADLLRWEYHMVPSIQPINPDWRPWHDQIQ